MTALSFNNLAANASSTSIDTFTLRQDRRYLFNPADLSWQINFKINDLTPPEITLLGGNPLNLTVGDTYNDPGATATGPLLMDVSTNGSAVAGGRALYTITVSNVSAVPIYTLSLKLQVPPELQFNGSSDAQPNTNCVWCENGDEASWALGTLASGESHTITINAPVLDNVLAGSLINALFRLTSPDVIDNINRTNTTAVNN